MLLGSWSQASGWSTLAGSPEWKYIMLKDPKHLMILQRTSLTKWSRAPEGVFLEIHTWYIYIYIYIFIYFRHTTCESMCNTLSSSAANQGDNIVSVAQRGTATPGATKQLSPLDRVFKRNIYLYICQIN